MTDLATQLNRGNADLIYLVEFNVLKLADGSVVPLYFSNKPFYAADKQFLPAISSISDLDRSGNDTMDPAYLPTWGDMSFYITGAYKPDAENSLAWNLLLYKDAYTMAGQALTIKIGTPADAYAAFTIIFTGNIGEISWTDAELNLTVYDKAKELETNYPDYELPESDQVDEDSWGEPCPIVLGKVRNYTPVLMKTTIGLAYPSKYALACHAIDAVENVYFDQNTAPWILENTHWIWEQKDLSPPGKDLIYLGAAKLDAYGPYTGALFFAKWIIQIESITTLNSQGVSGSEVGLAWFKWKLEGGAWSALMLTWKLIYDITTLVKSPAVGAAVMVVSGTYTGDCKLTYKTKITRGGTLGDPTPPQFTWSDDNGVTWSAPVDILNTNPIALNMGLSVAFSGAGVAFVVGDIWTWGFKEAPISLGDGVTIQWTTQPGQDFYVGDEFTFILMSTISTYYSSALDLTVDARGLINPATNLFASSIGEMIYSLIRVFPEWEDTDFDLPSLAAFDLAFTNPDSVINPTDIPYVAGLVVDSPDSITSIIDKLITGFPALYSIAITGKFYIQELVPPVGIPVLTITDEQIMDLPEFVQLPDITKRVYLEYDKNYSTGTPTDSTASSARIAWLKKGNRSISRKDDSVLVNYPMASDIGPLETALNERTDAGALADKLLALYQVPHETMEVQVGLQAIPLDIGDVVEVIRDTFGQGAGQLYMVQGISINFTDGQSTVTLWR